MQGRKHRRVFSISCLTTGAAGTSHSAMSPAALVLGSKTNAAQRGLPWRAGVFWRRKDDTHPRCVQVFLVVNKVSVTATRMSTTRRCQKRAVARDIRGANTEVLAEVQ